MKNKPFRFSQIKSPMNLLKKDTISKWSLVTSFVSSWRPPQMRTVWITEIVWSKETMQKPHFQECKAGQQLDATSWTAPYLLLLKYIHFTRPLLEVKVNDFLALLKNLWNKSKMIWSITKQGLRMSGLKKRVILEWERLAKVYAKLFLLWLGTLSAMCENIKLFSTCKNPVGFFKRILEVSILTLLLRELCVC